MKLSELIFDLVESMATYGDREVFVKVILCDYIKEVEVSQVTDGLMVVDSKTQDGKSVVSLEADITEPDDLVLVDLDSYVPNMKPTNLNGLIGCPPDGVTNEI